MPETPLPSKQVASALGARRRNARLVLVVAAAGAAAGAVLALLGGPDALLFDNLQELVAAGGAAIALGVAARDQDGPARRFQSWLAIALGCATLGMLGWDLSQGSEAALATAGDLLFGGAVVLGAAVMVPEIFSGLRREAVVGVALDTLILALAMMVVVAAILEGSGAPSARTAEVGATLLVGATGASAFTLLARRIVPVPGGPWVLLAGGSVVGVSWLMWLGDPSAPSVVGLSDFLFSAGLLLIGLGGVTWTTRPTTSVRFDRLAPLLAAGLPVAAVVGTMAVVAVADGPEMMDFLGISSAAVIGASVARQVHLYVRESRARAAELRAGQRLADEVRERSMTLLSLQQLAPGPMPEDTARTVCAAALALEGIDFATIRAYEASGRVVALAAQGVALAGADAWARLVETEAADAVRSRSGMRPWAWTASEAEDSGYHAALCKLGIVAAAYAPIVWNGEIVGDIALGTRSPETASSLRERLTTVEEFAVVVAALVGPALSDRQRVAARRRAVEAVAAHRAFHPEFEPIVDLESREMIGYASVTQFDSGEPSDRCVAEAWSVGAGAEFELVMLESALAASTALPAGRWLAHGVSPRLLLHPRLASVLSATDRPLILELTALEGIDDYPGVRRVLSALGPDVRAAVDYGGAGVSGFSHILELRPDLVTIDVGLVRRVNVNVARQAMVVGLHHFARSTGCRLIAKGIETEEEAATLVRIGVEFGMGALVDRRVAAVA